MKFAAWLSPEFELWMMERIEDLLTKGQATIRPPAESWHQPFAELTALVKAMIEKMDQKPKPIESERPAEIHQYLTVKDALVLWGNSPTSSLTAEMGIFASEICAERGIAKKYLPSSNPAFSHVGMYPDFVISEAVRRYNKKYKGREQEDEEDEDA